MGVKVEKKFVLILNRQEAAWLRNYMQNQVSDNESGLDSDMIAKIFYSLKEEVEKEHL